MKISSKTVTYYSFYCPACQRGHTVNGRFGALMEMKTIQHSRIIPLELALHLILIIVIHLLQVE